VTAIVHDKKIACRGICIPEVVYALGQASLGSLTWNNPAFGAEVIRPLEHFLQPREFFDDAKIVILPSEKKGDDFVILRLRRFGKCTFESLVGCVEEGLVVC